MKKHLSILIILILSTFSSCNKVEELNNLAATKNAENFVSKKQVEQILDGLALIERTNSLYGTKTGNLVRKNIKEIIPIADKAGTTAFYIVNLDKGFVVISADMRTMPVLAYSEDGACRIDDVMCGFNDAVGAWLEDMKYLIGEIRYSSKVNDAVTLESAWLKEGIESFINGFNNHNDEKISVKGYPEEPDPDTGCVATDKQIGPLLSTTWGQGTGYNDMVPLSGCLANMTDNGDKAPAGCAAVAIAQVMKYNQYPQDYPWAAMPDTTGSLSTAVLMADIGRAANIQYTCIKSSTTSKCMLDALKNDFGYSNATLANFDVSKVEWSLDYRRLVILSGTSTQRGGHAWVCDGFRRYIAHIIDDNGHHTDCGTYYYLHMNWGWNGKYDGWYGYSNWTVDGASINKDKKMIYNIAR